MLAKDNMPLRTVEKSGFLNLLKTAVPYYKAPSRKTVTKLLETKYEEVSEKVKKELTLAEHLTLTTDIWTETSASKSFMSLTVHYLVTSTMQLTSVEIALQELNEPHCAEYLSQVLDNLCDDWRLPKEKVIAVITDGGANIVAAVNLSFGPGKQIPCFAHTINLIAQKSIDAVPELKRLINKVKDIVTYFKRSNNAADELRKNQLNREGSEGAVLKLIQECPTRWNSTYYMMQRFVCLYPIVGTVLLNRTEGPEMITLSELGMIKEALLLLGMLEQVTRELCGEKYVSISRIIPLVYCLSVSISRLKTLETGVAASLKKEMDDQIRKRLKDVEKVKTIALATLLDPRFKKLNFQSPINAATAVNTMSSIIKATSEKENTTQKEKKQGDTTEDRNCKLWDCHDELVEHFSEVSGSKEGLPAEIKLYFQQNVIDRKSCPFKFWKNSNGSFPNLYKLALKYLPILATSVPSERLFSKAGAVVRNDRSRLTGKRINKLVFLGSADTRFW